jgi:hypothetical protein
VTHGDGALAYQKRAAQPIVGAANGRATRRKVRIRSSLSSSTKRRSEGQTHQHQTRPLRGHRQTRHYLWYRKRRLHNSQGPQRSDHCPCRQRHGQRRRRPGPPRWVRRQHSLSGEKDDDDIGDATGPANGAPADVDRIDGGRGADNITVQDGDALDAVCSGRGADTVSSDPDDKVDDPLVC